MVLQLKGLFAGGIRHVDFDYELDLSGFQTADGNHPFREPVHVTGAAVSRAGVVSLRGRADFRRFTRCDRCLREIIRSDSVPVTGVLVPNVSAEYERHEEWRRSENDELIPCPDARLDLDEVVLSDVALSLPMKELCREDCKGLCPVCGHNLNDGDCGCAREDR